MPWIDLEIPSDDEMRKLRQGFRGNARFLVDENAGDEVAEWLACETSDRLQQSTGPFIAPCELLH